MRIEEEVEAGAQLQGSERGDTAILMMARVEQITGLRDGDVLTVLRAPHLLRLHGRMETRGLGRGGHTRGLLGDQQVQEGQKTSQETVDLHRAYHQDHRLLVFRLRHFSSPLIQISHCHPLRPYKTSTEQINNSMALGLLHLLHLYITSTMDRTSNNMALGHHRLLRETLHINISSSSTDMHSSRRINNSKQATKCPLALAVGSKETGEGITATGTDLAGEETIAVEVGAGNDTRSL